MMNDKTDILSSKISVWNLSETVQAIRDLCRSNGKHYVCVSNVHTVVMGMKDFSYQEVTNQATLATADGVPLIWASKILQGPRIHGRASGPDVLAAMLVDSDCRDLRHCFFGSTLSVLSQLEKRLSTQVETRQLAGFISPPMRPSRHPQDPLDAEELAECERINALGASIIWVGLGAPKQEIWMYRARKHLQAPVLIGVGAAFDFLAGNKSRAPEWMRQSGLEWLFRFGQEPKRLASRYLKTNPVFVASVLKQALLQRVSP